MALPDTILRIAGTPIVWASTGGTYAFAPTSLANDAGWMGGKGDLGAAWADEFNMHFETKVATAPTDGLAIEIYWCQSTSATAGTANPGGLSGVSGLVTAPDQVKRQLIYLGPLILSNTIGTGVQAVSRMLYPRARYGFPVIVNKSGVALSATATDHRITITPATYQVTE
jgi:hypothetical protein